MNENAVKLQIPEAANAFCPWCVEVFAAAPQGLCPAMIVLKNVRSGQRAYGEQKCAYDLRTPIIEMCPTVSELKANAVSGNVELVRSLQE